jgi:hypothetical protein
MELEVEQFVSQCMVCDWVYALCNAPIFHSQPLLIMGLGY